MRIDRHMGGNPPVSRLALDVAAVVPEPGRPPVYETAEGSEVPASAGPQPSVSDPARAKLRAEAEALIISPAARQWLTALMDKIDFKARRKEPLPLRQWHTEFVGPTGTGQRPVVDLLVAYLRTYRPQLPFVAPAGTYFSSDMHGWVAGQPALGEELRKAKGGIFYLNLDGSGTNFNNHSLLLNALRDASEARPGDEGAQFMLIVAADDFRQLRASFDRSGYTPPLRSQLRQVESVSFELHPPEEFARLLVRCLLLRRPEDDSVRWYPLSPEVALVAAMELLGAKGRGGADDAEQALDRAIAACEARDGEALVSADFARR